MDKYLAEVGKYLKERRRHCSKGFQLGEGSTVAHMGLGCDDGLCFDYGYGFDCGFLDDLNTELAY
jgi:hypothetical protein